jgi:hypothetical protein
MTARVLFFMISCFAVAAVGLLGTSVFQSTRVGLFSAFAFLGFSHFALRAGSGPEVKSAMVLFETLCLLFAGRRHWFWAGLSGALATLIWQPAAIFPLTTLAAAAAQPGGARRSALFKALGGMGLPVLALAVYFSAHGALYEWLDATLLFGVRYLERGYPSPLTPFANIVWQGFTDFQTAMGTTLIGMAMIGSLTLSRLSQYRSGDRVLGEDPFAPILISFPLTVVWSLIDFGGGTDFYWFLPTLSVGFGRVLDLAVTAAEASGELTRRSAMGRVLSLGVSLALLTLAALTALAARETGLRDQMAVAADIERRFSRDVRLLTIGVPEILVLLGRENPTRHILLHYGFDRRVEATTPGGLEGWIAGLEAYRPDIVVFPQSMRQSTDKLMEWLESRYREETAGTWRLYVRKP